MIVLSLFDGISCGRVALERAGISVGTYYAAEIDEAAIKISRKNYPDIVQLGDVTGWRSWNINWSAIDLVIGGSPCQGFSSAGKRLNFDDPRSKLFFEFVAIVNHVKTHNPAMRFLLENVLMSGECCDVITQALQVDPVRINSALLSAQNRNRLYWTNIGQVSAPPDKNILLQDILEDIDQAETIGDFKKSVRDNVVAQYADILLSDKDVFKLDCTSGWVDNQVGLLKSPPLRHGSSFCLVKTKDDKIRRITVTEAERLQTLPDKYTAAPGVTPAQRFGAIGNGWTVDVIVWIFSHLLVEEVEDDWML